MQKVIACWRAIELSQERRGSQVKTNLLSLS